LVLIAFLCWCAVKQSINQSWKNNMASWTGLSVDYSWWKVYAGQDKKYINKYMLRIPYYIIKTVLYMPVCIMKLRICFQCVFPKSSCNDGKRPRYSRSSEQRGIRLTIQCLMAACSTWCPCWCHDNSRTGGVGGVEYRVSYGYRACERQKKRTSLKAFIKTFSLRSRSTTPLSAWVSAHVPSLYVTSVHHPVPVHTTFDPLRSVFPLRSHALAI